METIDGVRLTIRPITADDKAALVDAFRHLSEQSVYRRFLAPVKRLTESEWPTSRSSITPTTRPSSR